MWLQCITSKITRRKLANIKKQENIKYSIEEIRKNVMEMTNLFKSILKRVKGRINPINTKNKLRTKQKKQQKNAINH